MMVGVIEGFYGPPWSIPEREQLFSWMVQSGLNAYLYAPKDDLHHRQIWRELYSADRARELASLIERAQKSGISFCYGIAPGLDIRFSQPPELDSLKARFDQLLALGVESFALLFDDIPDRMHPNDSAQFDSFAAAQCFIANQLFSWLRERSPVAKMLFCPTPYCWRMHRAGLGGSGYLNELGRALHPEISVFWTGPEIISREISVPHLREVRALLRRKPVIWDNLHANDYDGRRFFCGPYTGRDPAILSEIDGLFTNPNTEFPLNYLPLATLGRFAQDPRAYSPREAWEEKLRDWLPEFATTSGSPSLEDLRLFADCFYLPFQEGPSAQNLLNLAHKLIHDEAAPSELDQFLTLARRLIAFCNQLAACRNRPLAYALWRRAWDLREELDLLERYVLARQRGLALPFRSDFHLPGTFRGGFISRLQNLLHQNSDGSWQPAS